MPEQTKPDEEVKTVVLKLFLFCRPSLILDVDPHSPAEGERGPCSKRS